MSLTVSQQVLDLAQQGAVDRNTFIEVIKTSLPNAWQIVTDLVSRKQSGVEGLVEFAPIDLDDGTRGELLRMFASNSMRGAIESFFGMRLAFQNCHKVGIFGLGEDDAYAAFTSIEAQILNQAPGLVNC